MRHACLSTRGRVRIIYILLRDLKHWVAALALSDASIFISDSSEWVGISVGSALLIVTTY